jgi:hypothetical protein
MKFADDEEQAFFNRVKSKEPKGLEGKIQSPKRERTNRGRNPQSVYSPSPR